MKTTWRKSGGKVRVKVSDTRLRVLVLKEQLPDELWIWAWNALLGRKPPGWAQMIQFILPNPTFDELQARLFAETGRLIQHHNH